MNIEFSDFEKIDIRVGKIVKAEEFPQARKPAYKLTIDYGADIGIKKSSAQITKHYSLDDLNRMLVLGVVNFPPKQIGPFISESLTLGVADENGDVVLAMPDKEVMIGSRLF